jgi:hypothetical protein
MAIDVRIPYRCALADEALHLLLAACVLKTDLAQQRNELLHVHFRCGHGVQTLSVNQRRADYLDGFEPGVGVKIQRQVWQDSVAQRI